MKVINKIENNLKNLHAQDPKIAKLVDQELDRQRNSIELIASENFTYRGALEAAGSVLTNKYAEGYPDHRYYGGCEVIDKVEKIAIERVCKLFGCKYANVQPHSGSSANLAAYHALANIGDTIMGLALDNGGHLTHGSPVNFSGIYYDSQSYTLNKETEQLDYDLILKQAKKVKPKVIVAGYSAYPRKISFKKMRDICNKVGAYLLVDMAHIAGLVATKQHPNPFPYAHVVTSTTHKTLRGPRSGIILTNDKELAKKINKAVFPGLQGGPLMHIIAAKAVCFKYAASAEYKNYIKKTMANAKAIGKGMEDGGLRLITGGTDNHLCLVDVSVARATGKQVEAACDKAFITVNKNTIPNEKLSPFVTSGIRVGTPAVTTRGFTEKDCYKVGQNIAKIAFNLNANGNCKPAVLKEVQKDSKAMLKARPLYAGSQY
ncbi:MAG: serine hydroxymethyltransferase [Coriobacteriia bacterium]|nr:serine hydroxymethyltransferase [Coriobacteriia bacterium]